MTASELPSLRKRLRSEASLQAFALNCCVPETLSEVVLGTVSTAVAAVTDHRNDYLAVFLVVGENLLKSIAQVVEVNVLTDLRLEDARLHLGRGAGSRETNVVKAEPARLVFEEVARGGSRVKHVDRRWLILLHSRLGVAGRLRSRLDSSSEEFSAYVTNYHRLLTLSNGGRVLPSS